MNPIFPGKMEEKYAKWLLSSSLTLLVILLMVDHLGNEVFTFFSAHYWIFLFLLPVVCHAFLALSPNFS